MEAAIPRQNIPEAMAPRAHCPVCNTLALEVVRSESSNDQLRCKRCSVVFDVEQASSPRLRLVVVPKPLPPTLGGYWLTAAEIRAAVREFIQRKSAMVARPAEIAQPRKIETPATEAARSSAPLEAETAPLVQSGGRLLKPSKPTASGLEADRRAHELYRLGNAIPAIRAILEKGGNYTAEEIEAALAEISALEQKKQARARRWIMAVGIFLLVCLALMSIGYLISTYQQTDEEIPAEVPGVVPSSTLALEEFGGALLPATQSVNILCPQEHSNAAEIIGGVAKA